MTTASTPSIDSPVRPNTPENLDIGYGRARLRLGIIGVGLWVVVSSALLITNAMQVIREQLSTGFSGDLMIITLLLVAYVLIQLPLDYLGGYLVPKRFGRNVEPINAYIATLTRGLVAHTSVLFCSALILYLSGSLAGLLGAFLVGMLWTLCLAAGRPIVARVVASFSIHESQKRDAIDTKLIHSSDEGFTGGITGLLSPKTNIMSARWRKTLGDEQFDLAEARRAVVMQSGAWRAGRIGAVVYTSAGLLVALWLAGPAAAGTAVGVVETGLWFTLWSFAGLLILPTLSRAAVYNTDQQLIQAGRDAKQIDELAHQLDRFQDGEPTLNAWVERIFHPIPSASSRITEKAPAKIVYWDIARTSVYLGLGSLSLLTRSVHCNVGRPALWVWLPTD